MEIRQSLLRDQVYCAQKPLAAKSVTTIVSTHVQERDKTVMNRFTLRSAIAKPLKMTLRQRRLPIMELRNKLLFWPDALAMHRLENREVARLSAKMHALPKSKVAVVIPTYNRPDLLLRAVHSALAQTVQDITVMIVDDGYGRLPEVPSDHRLIACSLSTNTGSPSIARNVGIRLTKSEYVAFLDDDNQWAPEHLEVALAALQGDGPGGNPGFVYTAVQRIFPDGRVFDVLSTDFNRKLLACSSFVDTNSIVIKRFAGLHWTRIRRSRKRYPLEDWELAYRLSRTMAARHVPVPTVLYLINPESYFTNFTNA